MFRLFFSIVAFSGLSRATSTADPSEFVDSVSTVAPIAARCNATERGFWRGNGAFTREYQFISARNFGSGAGTTSGLVAAYGQYASRECFSCLGDATECGRDNCFFPCLINQQNPSCQECINTHCRPALIACTGAASLDELPAPPTQPLPSEPTTSRPIRSRPAPATTAGPDQTTTSGESFTTPSVGEQMASLRHAIRATENARDNVVLLILLVSLLIPMIGAFIASRMNGGA